MKFRKPRSGGKSFVLTLDSLGSLTRARSTGEVGKRKRGERGMDRICRAV